MIGSLRGRVVLKTDKFLVLETGGVGYKVNASLETLIATQHMGEQVFFWVHTHLREDSLELYGFLNQEELNFFELLIGVSGIGPKGALAVLGVAPVDVLVKAISSGDISYLTKISGIGKKTAEKIVIELRDKFGEVIPDGSLQGELDVLEALKSLGYSQSEAREALKGVPAGINTNEKIREALKALGAK
jgi:holliday junction DNA helicase RuvA